MRTSVRYHLGLPLFFSLLCVLMAGPVSVMAADHQAPATLFAERCGICHDQATHGAPPRYSLASRLPSEIVDALSHGPMRQMAAGLTKEQVKSIAVFVTKREMDVAPNPNANLCPGSSNTLVVGNGDWPNWGRDVTNSRFNPAAGLAPSDVSRLMVKWAFALPGAAGAPTVAAGRLFVTSLNGRVYSLDVRTGCTYWSYNAGHPVRVALGVATLPAGRTVVFFGDQNAEVQVLDGATGRVLWRTIVDKHPLARITGSPTYFQGYLYVPLSSFEELAASDSTYPCCTFRGSLVCLNIATGEVAWKSYTVVQQPKPTRINSAGTQMFGPAGAAIWTTPTIDAKRSLVYVSTGDTYTNDRTDANNALIAFDLKSGRRAWIRQAIRDDAWIVNCENKREGNCPAHEGPDFDFSSPPVLHAMPDGREILTAANKDGVVYAFNPDESGAPLWQARAGHGTFYTQVWGTASNGENLFIGTEDIGTGQVSSGGISAIDLTTGKILWHQSSPTPACDWGANGCLHGQSSAIDLIPGVVFSGALDGHLRGFAAANGRLLCDIDLAKSWQGVNGVTAIGGSIAGSAVTIAEGTVFVNSGNATMTSPRHGSAILALTPRGKPQ